MKRLVWAGVGAILAATLVGTANAQDLNTLLTYFIQDLRNGTLGVTSPITRMRVGDGTAALPAYSFASETDLGILRIASGQWGSVNGSVVQEFHADNKIQLGSGGVYAWTSTADASGAASDYTIGRASAGIGVATTTTFGSLGTPANGSFAFCTDCTPTTAASCPGTKASCVCAGSGLGSFAVRVNNLWYCPF